MSNEPEETQPSFPSHSYVMVCVAQHGYIDSMHKPEFHRVILNRPDPNALLFNLRESKQKPQPNIQKLSCSDCNIAVIDQNNHLWFHSMDLSITQTPINLSKVLLKKMYRVAMSSQQLIVQSKEAGYLISWGEQLRYDRQFKYIQTTKTPPTTLPLRFQQFECALKTSKFYYPSDADKRMVYPLQISSNKMKSFSPTVGIVNCNFRIKGVCMSKYHNLCWDFDGKIYSWGHRSVGLGYFQSLLEKQVLQPRQIIQLEQQFIISAHCSTNYSIAVTTSGKFYQWGIVKKCPKSEEQVLYSPTKVQEIKDMKCICFKAKQTLCAMITNKYELYMWGPGSQLYTRTSQSYRAPTKVSVPEGTNVLDFDFGRDFIAIIGTNNPKEWPCQYYTTHKISQLQSIKSKLKRQRNAIHNKKDGEGIPRVSTEMCATFRSSKKKGHHKGKMKTYESILKQSECQFDCHKQVTRKKQYFDLQADQNKMLEYIFSSTNIQKYKCMKHLRIQDNLQNDRAILSQIQSRKLNILENLNQSILTIREISQNCSQRNNQFIKTKEKELCPPQKNSNRLRRQTTNISISPGKPFPQKTLFSTVNYSQRQKIIKMKKQQYDKEKRERMFAKCIKHSQQYRKKLKEQQERRMIAKKRSDGVLKIKEVLMKEYLCRIILRPIIEARIFLIEDFSKKLRYERCIRTIQLKYHQKRLQNRIGRLDPRQFFLLKRYVNRFVVRFRQRRRRYYINILEKEVIRDKVKTRLQFMAKMLEITVAKLRKLSNWYKMVTKNKIRSMTYKWNIFLANNAIFNIKNLPIQLSEFRAKQYEEMTTSVIYKGLVIAKPELSLKCFVERHPIFRINYYFLKSLHLISKNKQKIEENVQKASLKQRKVMFMPRKLSTQVTNLDKLVILPFSKDYQSINFSTNFQLRVSQRLLNQPRWISIEKETLRDLMINHLAKRQKNHRKAIKAYELEMAYFIKKNYQQLCNRRAKYIIIYNSLKPEQNKNRLMKQMVRILRKANLLDLLKDDYLPEKHALLQQAYKLPSCPTKPVIGDLLPKDQFKEMFYQYFTRMQYAANPRSKTNTKGAISTSK